MRVKSNFEKIDCFNQAFSYLPSKREGRYQGKFSLGKNVYPPRNVLPNQQAGTANIRVNSNYEKMSTHALSFT